MAFGKQQEQAEVRRFYDPYDEKDRKIILEFENLLKPYKYNFESYCRGTGLVVTYGRYALLGAVSRARYPEYREAYMKFHGIQYLRYLHENGLIAGNPLTIRHNQTTLEL